MAFIAPISTLFEHAPAIVPDQPPAQPIPPRPPPQQAEVEGAHARPVSRHGQRRRRRHPPARVRRARRRIAAYPQHEGRHARRLRRQRQATAGRQVEQGRRAAQLHHQRAQCRTTQRVHRGAQQRAVIGHQADHQPFGINAQCRQSGAVEHASGPARRQRSQPEQGRFPRRQPPENQRQPRSRRRFLRRGEEFMHPAPRQTAIQRMIERRMAGFHPRMGLRGWNALQRCDMPPQGSEAVHRLGHIFVPDLFFSRECDALSIASSLASPSCFNEQGRVCCEFSSKPLESGMMGKIRRPIPQA